MVKLLSKKFISIFVAIVLIAVMFTGCSSQSDSSQTQTSSVGSTENDASDTMSSQEESETRTVTDAVGNVVTVPADISKIAVVPLPWSSVIYAIDGTSERIVAMNPGALKAYTGSFFESLDPTYGNIDTSSIGADLSVNMEELVNLGAQAAIIWDYQEDEAKQLKELGITPIMIKNETIEELQSSLRTIGELLGKEERAQEFIDAYTAASEVLASYSDKVSSAEKPKVLYLRNADLQLQGNDNFIKTALELAGADNVAADVTEISMEEIMKMNPDIIFLSDFDTFVPDDLYNNTIDGQDWSSINAVKNHQVYKTPKGIYRYDAPGVETPLMMKWLAYMIQPEVFSDINIEQELKDYYATYFNHTLTQEELDQILNTSANANSVKR